MLHVDRSGAGGVLTLERPGRRNALDIEHLQLLRAAMERAVAERWRSVIVTAKGASFCGGADLEDVFAPGYRDELYGALRAIRSAPMPVIAMVNGPAVGAGTQLAIACDLRVAAPAATFSVPTAKLGLSVDAWTIRRLAALIGAGPATGLLLGCEELDVGQARDCGLVHRTGSRADAEAWAAELAELAPLTLGYSKAVLDDLVQDATSPELEAAFLACWTSEDVREGLRARAEGRAPAFEGR